MSGLGSLRVVCLYEAGQWFAQGLEIDYGAQADTLEEVKDAFVRGLKLTLRLWNKDGRLVEWLVPAVPKVWQEYIAGVALGIDWFTQDVSPIDALREEFVEITCPYDDILFLVRHPL